MRKKLFLGAVFLIILIITVKVGRDYYSLIGSPVLTGVIESEIEDYIVSLCESDDKETENIKTFVVVKNLKEEINKDRTVTLYAVILTEIYSEKEDNIQKISESFNPFKFILYNTNVKKHEIIGDSNDYFIYLKNSLPEDVRNQFPNEDEKKIMKDQMSQKVYNYYKEKNS